MYDKSQMMRGTLEGCILKKVIRAVHVVQSKAR